MTTTTSQATPTAAPDPIDAPPEVDPSIGATVTPACRADVAIVGGGLAGLTLALQLKMRLPALDVVLFERRRHPLPEAAHKVGESSVEIQAHYLARMLGLEAYLKERQLTKFGFRFFFSDGAHDLAQVTELGASRVLSTQSYQLDRGRLENDLTALARERGVRLHDGCTLREYTLGTRGAPHRLVVDDGGTASAAAPRTFEADWFIDAAGRAGLLKRRLGLAQPNAHDAHAVWFRIGARIDVDDWSADADWRARCNPPNRWLSTNHLVGDGYWVWLIPLASGSHSVGIVADPALHPPSQLDSFDKTMAWLAERQPLLHADLQRKRHLLQDFAGFRRFSYGCRKLFSGADRWALTGEAGVFLDPFYSPGGDFIAIANTCITELIAQQQGGASVARLAGMYERIVLRFYESMLVLYVGQYPLFGDARVLPMKVLWDYGFYWGLMCQLFFQGRLTDVLTMTRLERELARAQALNVAVQRLLRDWAAAGRHANPPQLLDQAALPWFAELNRGLTDVLDDAAFAERIAQSLERLATLAAQIVAEARRDVPSLDCTELDPLLPAGAAAGDWLLFPAADVTLRRPLEREAPAPSTGEGWGGDEKQATGRPGGAFRAA